MESGCWGCLLSQGRKPPQQRSLHALFSLSEVLWENPILAQLSSGIANLFCVSCAQAESWVGRECGGSAEAVQYPWLSFVNIYDV
jgi:hypothetical protein